MHLIGVVDEQSVKGKENRVVLLHVLTPLVVDHQLAVDHVLQLEVLLLLWLRACICGWDVVIGNDAPEVVLPVDQEPDRFLLDAFLEGGNFAQEEAHSVGLLADDCLP